jgi:hypothetical protein
MKTELGQNHILHVAMLLDASGSMYNVAGKLVEVVDSQIQHWARRSQEWDHEIRVSIYLFADDVRVLVYDRDVLRLPSVRDFYEADGNTALVDATCMALEDLRRIPEIHAIHNFVAYLWTDGQENNRRPQRKPEQLRKLIRELPDNYTLAAFVPDARGITECNQYGIPRDNVQIWSTTVAGVEKLGESLQRSTDNLIRSHQQGMRGTRNLFSLDLGILDDKSGGKGGKVASIDALAEQGVVDIIPIHTYVIIPVPKGIAISDLVKSHGLPYTKGCAYYQLTKSETVQSNKFVCIREKSTGKVYGGSNARSLLKLPDHEVKVNSASHPLYDVFIQSTSTNRKLVAGTNLLVMKS